MKTALDGRCPLTVKIRRGFDAQHINAAEVAKCIGVKVLALTGAKESKLSELSDCTIKVPETETFKVQEYHLPVYHYLCAMVEKYFFV